MPKIENHAEHDFTFTRSVLEKVGGNDVVKTLDPVTFPRAGLRLPPTPDGQPKATERVMTPGRIEVSDEILAAMRAHPVAKHWFKGDAKGRPQLMVTEAGSPAKSKAALIEHP